MKIKDISGNIIKEGDIVNYYISEPLKGYKITFNDISKIGVFPGSDDLCLFQGPQITNTTYSNGVGMYAYQIIGNINTANEELLEKVKGI